MSRKVFSRACCTKAGMGFFALRDEIESQFDQYIFWGNYAFILIIDKDTLRPLWRKGACKPSMQFRCR